MRLFVTCTVLLVVALGAAYAGFTAGMGKLEALSAASARADAALDERVSNIESALLLLANDTATLRAGQASYAESEATAKQALQDALDKLGATVSAQDDVLGTLAKNSDISGIISAWSPFVYDITCTFKGTGVTGKSSASATLEQNGASVRFITNRHVVEMNGQALVACSLTQPTLDTTFDVPASRITISDEHDVAYGTLTETPPAMRASQRCSTVPTIGDAVVMLGYPAIGASESVTATEGIVSGFDEDYYTTSAKIEKGNSGGAAIDVQRDCFLGLPTLVFAGKIESLARILPVASL